MFASPRPLSGSGRKKTGTSSGKFNGSLPAYRSLIKKMTAMGLPQSGWDVIRDDELETGHPFPFLVMARHLLSPHGPAPLAVAEILNQQRWFVVEPDDTRFVHTVFRVLRKHFEVVPAISEGQFLRQGQFACDKGALVSELASLLRQRDDELLRRRAALEQQQHQSSGLRSIASRPSVERLGVVDQRVANASGAYTSGLNDTRTSRSAYEVERARVEARKAEALATVNERHRVLCRVSRRPPTDFDSMPVVAGGRALPPDVGAHRSPDNDACWYCSESRAGGSAACRSCGSPPAGELRRSPLNEGNLSANSSSSTH